MYSVTLNVKSWGNLSSLLKPKFLYMSMHWFMVIRDQQAENDDPKNEKVKWWPKWIGFMGLAKSARTDGYSWSLLLVKETESLPQSARADCWGIWNWPYLYPWKLTRWMQERMKWTLHKWIMIEKSFCSTIWM